MASYLRSLLPDPQSLSLSKLARYEPGGVTLFGHSEWRQVVSFRPRGRLKEEGTFWITNL